MKKVTLTVSCFAILGTPLCALPKISNYTNSEAELSIAIVSPESKIKIQKNSTVTYRLPKDIEFNSTISIAQWKVNNQVVAVCQTPLKLDQIQTIDLDIDLFSSTKFDCSVNGQ